MPRPCAEEAEDERRSYDEAVSKAVAEVVRQGLEENRVITGIPSCVEQIKNGAENVMLCLLIQISAMLDASLKVPLLLIKAYCQENGIDLLHILGEGEHKMAQLMSNCLSQSEKCRNVDIMPHSPQGNTSTGSAPVCIMVKYPKVHTSQEDDFVSSYVKDNMKKRTDPSVIIPELTETGMDKTLGFKLKTNKVRMATSVSPQ